MSEDAGVITLRGEWLIPDPGDARRREFGPRPILSYGNGPQWCWCGYRLRQCGPCQDGSPAPAAGEGEG